MTCTGFLCRPDFWTRGREMNSVLRFQDLPQGAETAKRCRSEVESAPHADAIDPAYRRAGRAVAMLDDVVELEFHVGVQKPIQAESPVVDLTPLDRLVIQVDVAEPRP